MREQPGIQVMSESIDTHNPMQGRPWIASVAANVFLNNPSLAEEVFGPFSLVVRCTDRNELHSVVSSLHGQLTCTVIGDAPEVKQYESLLNVLTEKAGRVILNGVPTGVEVCPSMHHGGPFPSTTDSRFSSVGTDAIKRFVRPVAYQNFENALLPDELKNENPLGIWRMVNGELKK